MGIALNFDATQVEPSSGGGGLPPGRYQVVIAESEAKPASSGNGGLLELVFKVTQGPHAGGTIKSRLNLWNTNPKAQEIAYKELSAICHCVQRFRVGEPQELHNIPLQIEVGFQKDSEQYTEVKRFFDVHGNPPKEAGKGPRTDSPAAATGGATGGGWGTAPGNAQPANEAANNGGAAAGGWGGSAPGNNGGNGGGTSSVQDAPAGWGSGGSNSQPKNDAPANNANAGGWNASNNNNPNAGGNGGGWNPPATGNGGGWQPPSR